MPQLNNTRWEMFALGLAAGKTQRQAYIDAGYAEGSLGNTYALAKNPEIKARVAELINQRSEFKGLLSESSDLDHLKALDEAAGSGEIDRAWIVTQLMDNAKAAREAGQFAASNKALELLGREIGMFQTGAPKESEDAAKPKALPSASGPLTVADINKVLAAVNYKGPPIDLTTKTPVIPHDHPE